MAEQKIELRKLRDFGEIISDTLVFIRQNMRPLLAAFVGIAGIFMLSSAIVSGIFQSQFSNIFQNLLGQRPAQQVTNFFSFFGTAYFVLILLAWLNFTAMKVVIIAYMKVYDSGDKETPSIENVWMEFKKYYLLVLVFTLPLFLLILVGCLLCLLPGLALWAILVPFEMLVVIENRSFSNSFSRCFDLVKKHFWMSLGVYVVAYLIYYFAALIIGFATALISGLLSYFTTRDISGTIGIAASVLNIFSFLFFILYYVAAVLNYFNLTERYDGTGMLKRLDALGNTNSDFKQTEEQY